MHLTPGLHGAGPDSVAPPEDMPPRPQESRYVHDPEGTWYGGTFGDEPLDGDFDPCGAPPLTVTRSNGEQS